MYTAIFGGTFNPIHKGHYQMLEALEKDSLFDEIFIMPDKIPPHKVCDFLAQDNVRIDMCKIAEKDFKKAKLCLIEFEREGKSYSYDTILLLQEKFPLKKFAFVCGGDMLVTLDEWYNYKELIKLLPFIVFNRADIDKDLFIKKQKELENMGAKIIVKNDEIIDISSTQIRNNFNNLKEYLPENIYSYLKKGRIYNE